MEKIKESIRAKYVKVAQGPGGLFPYPTGRAGLEKLGYDLRLVDRLPAEVVEYYCGVGNPFSIGPLHQGERVFDIGCGAAVDALIAALSVGPAGRVEGVDVVPEMLERAEINRPLAAMDNVAFHLITGPPLPFPSDSFEVVISNGVFNLVPDKAIMLKEAFRVLKPGGRLMMADQVLAGEMSADLKVRLDNWFR